MEWEAETEIQEPETHIPQINNNQYAALSDGRGSIISISKKQNLNTKSSTEEELIEADDAMPQMLWTRYFLEAQGYGIDENILYQDHMSAMLLEKNGKKSSTKNRKQINVRYYFIKDRVETGEVVIKHCPTEGNGLSRKTELRPDFLKPHWRYGK